jgi:hypothetical protein
MRVDRPSPPARVTPAITCPLTRPQRLPASTDRPITRTANEDTQRLHTSTSTPRRPKCHKEVPSDRSIERFGAAHRPDGLTPNDTPPSPTGANGTRRDGRAEVIWLRAFIVTRVAGSTWEAAPWP